MTLEEIFDQINYDYARVQSIASGIYNPEKAQVDKMHYEAAYYAKYAIDSMFVSTTTMARATARAAQYIVWELKYLVEEMYTAVLSTRSAIRSIFGVDMAYIVANVQNAVAFVQTEMYQEVASLSADINAGINYMQDYIDGEVAYLTIDIDQSIDYMQNYIDNEIVIMQSEMDSLSQNMLAWISEEVAVLTEEMNTRIAEVTQKFEASIAALNLYITQSNAEIYSHIELRNAEMMEQIMLVNDSLFDYINQEVEEINRAMENILRALSHKIASEVQRLDDIISVLSVSLTAKINELVESSTWQFSFFDIFTFRPELSLLRVLLRSDTDFERYKPYWQALFARILAED